MPEQGASGKGLTRPSGFSLTFSISGSFQLQHTNVDDHRYFRSCDRLHERASGAAPAGRELCSRRRSRIARVARGNQWKSALEWHFPLAPQLADLRARDLYDPAQPDRPGSRWMARPLRRPRAAACRGAPGVVDSSASQPNEANPRAIFFFDGRYSPWFISRIEPPISLGKDTDAHSIKILDRRLLSACRGLRHVRERRYVRLGYDQRPARQQSQSVRRNLRVLCDLLVGCQRPRLE